MINMSPRQLNDMHSVTNGPPPRKWYQWYSSDDTPEERKLVLKLDLLIVPYAFVLYFIKYIDQANISKHTLLLLEVDLERRQLVADLDKIMHTHLECRMNSTSTGTSWYTSRPYSS